MHFPSWNRKWRPLPFPCFVDSFAPVFSSCNRFFPFHHDPLPPIPFLPDREFSNSRPVPLVVINLNPPWYRSVVARSTRRAIALYGHHRVSLHPILPLFRLASVRSDHYLCLNEGCGAAWSAAPDSKSEEPDRKWGQSIPKPTFPTCMSITLMLGQRINYEMAMGSR
jgi:hypothetical protein